MQNKSAIQVFTVLLILVCIFQLSFTFVAWKVESDAEEHAAGDPIKEQEYLDSKKSEVVYDLLVKKYTYQEVKENEIPLGLDLRGGMNVVLEVDVAELIQAMSGDPNDTTLTKSLALARQYQVTSQNDFVVDFARAVKSVDPQANLATFFLTPTMQGRISFGMEDEQVIEVLQEEADDAIDRSFEVLRTRINEFGIAQPNIQRLEASGRILVELPGVKDKQRVRDLLQGTANLEFWETHDNREIVNFLDEANRRLAEILTPAKPKEEAKSKTRAEEQSQEETTTETVVDPNDTTVTDTTVDGEDKEPDFLKLLDDETKDTTEADQPDEGESPLFAVLQPYVFRTQAGGLSAPQGPVIGIARVSDIDTVNKYLNMRQIRQIFPRDLHFSWAKNDNASDTSQTMLLIVLKGTKNNGQSPAMAGDIVSDARQDIDQQSGKVEVRLNMKPQAAEDWARVTEKNKDKSIAIVLDGRTYSYPVVSGKIPHGNTSISGNFTIKEAKDLATVLRAGKLPAPAKIVEEAVVGPSLGKESIRAGFTSFIIALMLVLVYMIVYYGNAGVVSNLALLANMFFIIGVLASPGLVVLTLPGVAGIVLTIGMSVDANVLIYERIREELSQGKGIKLAIADGYKMAYGAIIDANVTTLLTGVILWAFGAGPVQGFAKTLVIGIFTSLFSAIFITRLIFLWQLGKNRSITFATKLTEGAFKNVNINFIGNRKIFYAISGFIIIAGIVSMATRSVELGVDFEGGRQYQVRFDQTVSPNEISVALAQHFGKAPEVKTYGPSEQVKITTDYRIQEDDPEIDREVDNLLYEGVKPFFKKEVSKDEFFNTEEVEAAVPLGVVYQSKVGPTIANDIIVKAYWAVGLSLLAIFLYIVIRFRRWQFGMGAFFALLHDVLIVLTLFSLLYGVLPFSLEIDQAFIAAILTVVGYSINDTVVVFDRIREYLGLHKKKDNSEVINMALNSTLSRTFNTSITIFVVLLAIFLFGGENLQGMTFALLIGVVVGTYSSLCIAAPVVVDLAKEKAAIKK